MINFACIPNLQKPGYIEENYMSFSSCIKPIRPRPAHKRSRPAQGRESLRGGPRFFALSRQASRAPAPQLHLHKKVLAGLAAPSACQWLGLREPSYGFQPFTLQGREAMLAGTGPHSG